MTHLLRPLLAALLLLAGSAAVSAAPIRFHIGTFAARDSAGIYTATLDPDTGALSAPALAAPAGNANWIAWHPRAPILYGVNDRREEGGRRVAEVVAYRADAAGQLTVFNREPTGLGGACHLGVDPAGTLLVGALYGEGAVVAYPLDAEGRLQPVAQTIRHAGSGPNAKRQEKPHAHGVTFDATGRFVFIPDLGIDQVVGYRVQPAAPRLTAVPAATAVTPPGAGPRHFVFHPNGRFAYAVNELDATVTQFAWDAAAAALTPVRTVRSLPDGAKMPNTSAEIAVHPNGRALYVSNRGHDSIAVLALEAATGAPTLVENAPAGGRTPRGFALDPSGRWLVVASQDDDRIVSLRIDPDTGRLAATDHALAVPAPVCILFGNR